MIKIILILLTNLNFIYIYLNKYLKEVNIIEKKKSIIMVTYFVYTVLFIIMSLETENVIDLFFWALLSSILLLITIVDLVEMAIPDELVVAVLGTTVLYRIVSYLLYGIGPEILYHLQGLLLGGLIFLLIMIISKGGIGQGDVTLISALGFLLGPYYILLNIFLSFFIGGIISIFLLLSKIKTRKDPIPFGPFIVIAFFITRILGNQILDWYFSLLAI